MKRTIFVRVGKVTDVFKAYKHYKSTSDCVSGKDISFWKEVIDFEKSQGDTKNQARSLLFELPLEWQTLHEKHLKKRCGKLVRQIMKGSVGYTVFIRTATNNNQNFHMVVLFCERMQADLFIVEKRDQYRCKNTGKIVSKNSETAIKIKSKGDIKKGENGRGLVNLAAFGIKNKKYKTKEWIHKIKQLTIQYYKRYSQNYTMLKQGRFSQVRYSGGTKRQKRMLLAVNSHVKKVGEYIAKNPKTKKARAIQEKLESLLQKNEFREALNYMSNLLKLKGRYKI